jgi:hypothetical protein
MNTANLGRRRSKGPHIRSSRPLGLLLGNV